jgi:hypothetical protein
MGKESHGPSLSGKMADYVSLCCKSRNWRDWEEDTEDR